MKYSQYRIYIPLFFLICFPLICFGSAKAQVKFDSSVSDFVIQGDQFELSYCLKGVKGEYFTDFEGPKNIPDFEIVEGPKKFDLSTSNDLDSIRTYYTYTLIAKKQGTFLLPAASVKMNGKTIHSERAELKVESILENMEEITFSASIEPKEIVKGEHFRLTYTLTQARGKNFEGPNSIKDFKILMGPNGSTSSSREIVNDDLKITYTESYSYELTSENPGVYTIPAATIVANGKTYTSNTERIKVVTPESRCIESQDVVNVEASTNKVFDVLFVFIVSCTVPFIFLVAGIIIVIVGASNKNKNIRLAGYVIIGLAVQIILFILAFSILDKLA